jgi:uncharacterized protein (TIGR03435 family)
LHFELAAPIVYSMILRNPRILLPLVILVASAQCQQSATTFEAASVRPSQHEVGPDYNNQITYTPAGFSGKNVTFRRLVAEAWNCQMKQVVGPPWFDRNEFEVSARSFEGATRGQIQLMLRTLLVDRFGMKVNSESRLMRVYELEIGKNGPKFKPAQDGSAASGGPGFHFRGDMREFADLLAVQFSMPAPESPGAPVRAGGPAIPVLDKTGLTEVYDFSVEMQPELQTDSFTGWKRALEDQLGLKVESRMDQVAVVVVTEATQVPAAN